MSEVNNFARWFLDNPIYKSIGDSGPFRDDSPSALVDETLTKGANYIAKHFGDDHTRNTILLSKRDVARAKNHLLFSGVSLALLQRVPFPGKSLASIVAAGVVVCSLMPAAAVLYTNYTSPEEE